MHKIVTFEMLPLNCKYIFKQYQVAFSSLSQSQNFFGQFCTRCGSKISHFLKVFFQMFILGSCYCTLIGRSPKWTALPKMNNCCSCPPIGRSPKRALPKMNIWKKPLENGNFCTWNVNKIGQKIVIREICWEGILSEKISSVGHSSP